MVLRIDSPGGSMFASQVISDELDALKAADKPLIASMSSVAASGGYYIAMPADEIWASNTTITGSIGVGAILPTVQRGLDQLGVHIDGFGTTKLAGQMRLDRPLGEDARRILTASVDDAYRIFVGHVAAARDMTPERADSIARGRVWIGADGKELGLVDSIGGLDEAVEAAASRAGLEAGKYGRTYIEPEMSFGQRLAAELVTRSVRALTVLGLRAPATVPSGLVRDAMRSLDRQVRALSALNDPRSLYYNRYLSRPFAVLANEALSPADQLRLQQQLDREILHSGAGIRAFIDPGQAGNRVIGLFAARVDAKRRLLVPVASQQAITLFHPYLMGNNPPPVGGVVALSLIHISEPTRPY